MAADHPEIDEANELELLRLQTWHLLRIRGYMAFTMLLVLVQAVTRRSAPPDPGGPNGAHFRSFRGSDLQAVSVEELVELRERE